MAIIVAQMKGPDLPGEVGAHVTRLVHERGGTGALAEPEGFAVLLLT